MAGISNDIIKKTVDWFMTLTLGLIVAIAAWLYSNVYQLQNDFPYVTYTSTYVDINLFIDHTKIYNIDNLSKIWTDDPLIRVDVYEIPNLSTETIKEIRFRTTGYKYITVTAPEHDAPKLNGETWVVKNLMANELFRLVAVVANEDVAPDLKLDYDGNHVRVRSYSEMLSSSGHLGRLAIINPDGFTVVVALSLMLLVIHAVRLGIRTIRYVSSRSRASKPQVQASNLVDES